MTPRYNDVQSRCSRPDRYQRYGQGIEADLPPLLLRSSGWPRRISGLPSIDRECAAAVAPGVAAAAPGVRLIPSKAADAEVGTGRPAAGPNPGSPGRPGWAAIAAADGICWGCICWRSRGRSCCLCCCNHISKIAFVNRSRVHFCVWFWGTVKVRRTRQINSVRINVLYIKLFERKWRTQEGISELQV